MQRGKLMTPVKVRNIVIGEGRPKICVSVFGKTKEEIIESAKGVLSVPVDIVEWRADYFEEVYDFLQVIDTLKLLRETLGDIPLLMTFRNECEGGEQSLCKYGYSNINIKAIQSGYIDLIDVELSSEEALARKTIAEAKAANVRVIVSSHDFKKTPSKEEIVWRLRKMYELGADIPKIAVMPTCKKDVITLLAATEEMATNYATGPIITMSMSKTGVISRLCGEAFGSAVTFGAAGVASAPGQVGVAQLEQMLDELHNIL